MKRHLALRELSVDHHHALVYAQRCSKAAAEGGPALQEAADAFLPFWRSKMKVHLKAEEDGLLPLASLHGFDMASSSIGEMLIQHAQIRGLVIALSSQAADKAVESGILARLGNLIEEHVRLEERVIFPAVQTGLSEAALGEIKKRVGAIEFRDPFAEELD